MKTGDHMKMTQEFMKAIQEELKRTGVVIELESGEGKEQKRIFGRFFLIVHLR